MMVNPSGSAYDALLSSIDFFSQNLHLEQIVEYGFMIFNAFEKPKASAIYRLNSETQYYELQFSQGVYHGPESILKTACHDDFAVRKGFMVTDRNVQQQYFESAVERIGNLSKIIPLIADDRLYGFIFSVDSDDETVLGDLFLTRFNYLMNLAIEKAFRYFERATMRQEIDKRIFNLESISQTMKVLFSELDTERILQMSLDVIRELTASSATAIGLFDTVEQCIKIRAYDDLTGGVAMAGTMMLNGCKPLNQQIIYHLKRDADALHAIFDTLEPFEMLSAVYLILMTDDESAVMGVITIGTPVDGKAYTDDIFERIGDIAALMSIALVKAQQYETIVAQKEALRLKFNTMQQVNKIIKSINRAESPTELYQLVMDALTLTFGVEAAAVFSFESDSITVAANCGIDKALLIYENVAWVRELPASELTVHYTVNAAVNQLQQLDPEGCNCMVLAPISMNQYGQAPLGYILVTRTRFRLFETQVSMIEMLSNSIAPVLYQMQKNQ
ncbi:hypothetical protein KHM83_07860 [Fusibacter paucivorans]|uniref:GAF domain-containing protein n=1 Tax=Fusibacter paucivorans TaxID=76009 RepID=A0ABS5PN51_9FIRM|nr:GAF domain-containing protein [Fusibacter paucivorans]MBS7526588.1 hypothetical protein [Fusibacter paucivorans]